MKSKFPIGTQFIRVGRKHKRVETVTDIITWTNNAGEIVNIRYVATHTFCNQTVTDRDISETTIARGIITEISK